MPFGGEVKLTGESEYRKAIETITQDLGKMSDALKTQASEFNSADKSMSNTQKQQKELTQTLEQEQQQLAKAKTAYANYSVAVQTQTQRHNALSKEYKNAVKELDEIAKTSGTASDEYKKQEQVVNDLGEELAKSTEELNESKSAMSQLKSEINSSQKVINQTTKEIDQLGNEEEEGKKKTIDFGSAFKSFGGVLKNVGVAVAGAVTALGTVATVAGKQIWDMANDVSKAGDEIDKSSQKLGISAENYQTLSYAMERSGASIDDVSKGVKTITKELADAENGVKGAGKQFEALGVSLKNADGSMKSTEDVLLESIDALASMENETQRNALAQQIFGKSASELAPLLNSGADGISDLMQEAKDYGMVMSDEAVTASANFQDSLTRMQGTINGVKSNLIGEFLPSIGMIVDGFSDLVAGNDGATEKISEGVSQLVENISSALPDVIEIISTIATSVLESAPTIIQSLATGIIEAIPQLVPVVADIISELTTTLISMLPEIISAGIDILLALIQGITNEIPALISMLPTIIATIVQTLISKLPDIINTGVKLLQALISGIGQMISQVASKAGEVGQAILTKLGEFPSKVLEVGTNIVKGIWNGISGSLGWIKDQISGWVGNVTSFIKNLFGIKSPSKLYRDEIGKNLALGIGEGFSDEMENVSKEMAGAIPTEFDTNISTSGSSSTGFDSMVMAFKQALSEMKIELDDEEVGSFVDRTVTNLVYQ